MTASATAYRVSLWCRGPEDNIGDVVLRRSYLRTLQEIGPCSVFVGEASASFVSGLHLRQFDRAYRSKLSFLLHLLGAAARGRWVFAFNPGELRLGRTQAVNYAVLAPILVLARFRRARILALGIGLVPEPGLWHLIIRAVLRLATLVSWRDEVSFRIAGRGFVQPDWAVDDRSMSPPVDGGQARRLLAISIRGDRPVPSEQWIAGVSRTADQLELEPVLFVQVRRDGERARFLAGRLGATCVDWPADRTHEEQELAVRSLLARSEIVLSDRLHAAVMGLVEGATPVCIAEHGSDKVQRHLEVIGIDVGPKIDGLLPSDAIPATMMRAVGSKAGVVHRWGVAVDELAAVRALVVADGCGATPDRVRSDDPI